MVKIVGSLRGKFSYVNYRSTNEH